MITDSAGVEVVSHPSSVVSRALRWSMSGTPERTLGGDAALFRVVDVRPLPGGGVAVANGSTQEIVEFAPEGFPRPGRGGAGDGPGEFRGLASVVPLADGRLGGFDARLRRVTIFDDDAPPTSLLLSDALPRWVRTSLLVSRDRWVLFGEGGITADLDPVDRASVESVALAPDGRILARYGPFPGDELFAGNDLGVVMFGAVLEAALVGDRLVVGDSDRAELRVFGPDGGLERLIRWPEPERAVTDARVDEWIRGMASGAEEDRRAAVEERLRTLVPRGDVLPAFHRILGADDGRIWVGRYHDPEQAVRTAPPQSMTWRVFGLDGALVARLDTPDGIEVHAVAQGRLWGVHHDGQGVETVRAYRYGPG
ncbi:MAG: hypothetical protein RJQ04_04755 [Longimicrobiales bacterium]